LNTKKQGKNETKINYFEKLTKRTFYEIIKFDDLAKSPKKRHPGKSRGPELIEITGFRLPPE